MKWNRYTIKTTTAAEDILTAALADIGIEGVEIEDSVPLSEDEISQMFVDIPPVYGEDDGTAKLHFYLDPETDNEAMLESVRQVLIETAQFIDIGEGTITASETEDVDWINNWKEYFHSFSVDDILVVPSWEEVPEDSNASMILRIDPGTAFGTGMHETTQLCIRALKEHVRPGCRVLDVGTGSGILGIVAVKLGAESVLGTDLDPCTIPAVEENMAANDIPEDRMSLILGNIIDDEALKEAAGFERYDIVTSNILADVLIPMAPSVYAALKKGGIWITSGILDRRAPDVEEAARKCGFEILETSYQGEWARVTARK